MFSYTNVLLASEVEGDTRRMIQCTEPFADAMNEEDFFVAIVPGQPSGEAQRGVFSRVSVPNNTAMFEYTGVIVTPRRDPRGVDIDSQYQLALPASESNPEVVTIDAKVYGNISRFCNHNVMDANMELRYFIDKDGMRRAILRAKRDINQGEQLCYDYGARFGGLNDTLGRQPWVGGAYAPS
jgi:hypothetical protein